MKDKLLFDEVQRVKSRLKGLFEERRTVERKLKEIRKKPFFEDRIAYISSLNTRLLQLEHECDALLYCLVVNN